MKQTALSYFPRPYNCAQAVRKSMEKHHEVSPKEIKALRKAGHGRAKGGVCGAIHAAYLASDCPDYHARVDAYFEKHGGSIQCRKIRRSKKMSCNDCVEESAHLAEQEILKNRPLDTE